MAAKHQQEVREHGDWSIPIVKRRRFDAKCIKTASFYVKQKKKKKKSELTGSLKTGWFIRFTSMIISLLSTILVQTPSDSTG